jgi:hypothetical protein
VPDSFIDDALEKFRVHELEKGKSKIVKQGSSQNISAAGACTGSNHNISTGVSSSSSSHNIPVAITSTDSSGHPNQAHVPASSVMTGLCRDEEHCRAGLQVRLLLQIHQNHQHPVWHSIFW